MKNFPLWVGAGVTLGALALYLSTAAPSLSWGWDGKAVDGGEFLAAAKTLGVPHPPGYPTYTLLLKAFATVVPVGDFAYRGNLLSAVLASASVLTVYMVTLRFCRWLNPDFPEGMATAAAALSGLVLAGSPLFWSQATITEVYTLNALFVALLLLLAADLALTPGAGPAGSAPGAKRKLALFGLLLGLGLGNHLTLAAVALPLLIWLWSVLGWRGLARPWTIGAFVLGLAVYAYLPLSAAQHPPVNWGNANTFEGLVWMLTAQPYQEYVFGVPVASLSSRFVSWADLVFSQFNPLGLFLGLVGIVPLRSRAPWFLFPVLGAIVVLSVYALTYSTVDFEVLMVPAFLLFSVWIGVGFFWIITTWIPGAVESADVSPNGHPVLRVSRQPVVLGALAVLLIPGFSLALNYGSLDLGDDVTARDHARGIMDTVPDGSIVLSNRERNLFSLWYMRYVDTPGRDVAVIAVPLLQFDWYLRDIHRMFPDRVPSMQGVDDAEAVGRIVAHNGGGPRVFFTFSNLALADAFDLTRVGVVYEASLK